MEKTDLAFAQINEAVRTNHVAGLDAVSVDGWQRTGSAPTAGL
jgi:hypothetical protein